MNKYPYCNNEIYLICNMQKIHRYNNENKAWVEIEKLYRGHQYICNTCLQVIHKSQIKEE